MAESAKFVRAKRSRLSEVPITNGQIIFVVDYPQIYMDFGGMRLPYSVQLLEDDSARLALSSPIMGCYYLTDKESVLWYYGDNGWRQLTPSNPEQVYFAKTAEDLPKEGKEDMLYTVQDAVLRYDTAQKEYYVVSNKTAWENIS